MLYTQEQIKEVLWNTFKTYAKNIEFVDQVGDEYWYNIELEDSISMDKFHEIGMDLYDSTIFDVINKGENKLLVKYIAESDILELNEIKSLNEKLSNDYIEFNEGQLKRYKKLYDNLKENLRLNSFIKKTYDLMQKNKKLSSKQWIELKYVLENGKTRYEDKKLSTKN